MSNGVWTPVCLVILLVPRSQSYLRPEPPETHFFLAAGYHLQARLHRVFYTESTSTEAELLCVEETEEHQLELLAHLICSESGFPTFTSFQTSESEVSSLYSEGRKVSDTIEYFSTEWRRPLVWPAALILTRRSGAAGRTVGAEGVGPCRSLVAAVGGN